MEEVKALLREILEALRAHETAQRQHRRQLDEIEGSIAAIARSFEQEDRLQERQERAEARERERAAEALEDLKTRVENLGSGFRGLDQIPERTLTAMERRIDEWRRAKYEAEHARSTAMVSADAELTSPGAYSMRRDPTQSTKIAVAQHEPEDITGVFDRTHTDGERRALKEFVGGIALYAWQRGGKWAAAIGSGGGLYHLLHKLGIL